MSNEAIFRRSGKDKSFPYGFSCLMVKNVNGLIARKYTGSAGVPPASSDRKNHYLQAGRLRSQWIFMLNGEGRSWADSTKIDHFFISVIVS